MKKLPAFTIMFLLLILRVTAQEEDSLNWNIDSIFDEPFSESGEEGSSRSSSVLGAVNQRGITFSFSYEFQGGFAPGWNMTPWHFNGEEEFTWGLGVKMNSDITIDARLSDVFRVLTVIEYKIPEFGFFLGDFFFDYNILNAVFVRAGKYEHSWGISPNYGFTNLLSRVPSGSPGGASFVFKADVPVGIGGIQALALTRADLMGGTIPGKSNIGFGGKYNLAFRWVDFDIGALYQEEMALRAFLSIKTTLWNTELYNEWLLAVNTHSDNEASFACNLGFARDFFDGKLSLNGEFFYNGEKDTQYYRPETALLDEDVLTFIDNFSMAMNVIYRFSGKGDPRFFTQVLYSPGQLSARLVPGFRITPLKHIEVYFAVPMALGDKNGYYYKNTADPTNRPSSIMLYVTLKDSVQAGYYY